MDEDDIRFRECCGDIVKGGTVGAETIGDKKTHDEEITFPRRGDNRIRSMIA